MVLTSLFSPTLRKKNTYVGYFIYLDMLQIFQFVLRSGLTSIAHHELGELSSEPRKEIIRENMIEMPEIMSGIDKMNREQLFSLSQHESSQATVETSNTFKSKQIYL